MLNRFSVTVTHERSSDYNGFVGELAKPTCIRELADHAKANMYGGHMTEGEYQYRLLKNAGRIAGHLTIFPVIQI